MNHDGYDPDFIRDILTRTESIAMVGASPNPARPSNGVLRFLLAKGYEVIPVNPRHAGKAIHGRTVIASLADPDRPVDMVDVFRAADRLSSVVEDVLAMRHRPRVIWAQLGVRDAGAARRAEAAGISMIMDRCPAIEYRRLIG